jgi:hypothetical protein
VTGPQGPAGTSGGIAIDSECTVIDRHGSSVGRVAWVQNGDNTQLQCVLR